MDAGSSLSESRDHVVRKGVHVISRSSVQGAVESRAEALATIRDSQRDSERLAVGVFESLPVPELERDSEIDRRSARIRDRDRRSARLRRIV